MTTPTKMTLSESALGEVRTRLKEANLAFATRFPGERSVRQPVHTVYGGAHLFRFDAAPHLGALGIASLEVNAPDAQTFAKALNLPIGEGGAQAETIYARVLEKLRREPVEDYRIDFEDGYGSRADAEEDGHCVAAAREVAKGFAEKTLPPFIGIRIKPFTEELFARGFRTLDIFLTELIAATKGKLPPGFIITLPKVQNPEQVAALTEVLELLEPKLGLAPGVGGAHALTFEIMIEQTQAVFDAKGRVPMPLLIDAAKGRCTGAHLGTYDYTASCGITAAHQRMSHPACDFAKNVMQVTLGGTGIQLSDGATNIMPVGSREAVHDAWRLHASDIRHSLETGYYQGWDLHPAQLPSRFAAVYAFFLEGLAPASERLKNFIAKAAQATLVGDVFDDAATGQGLLNFFLRGITCGAITEDEALATGLTIKEIRGRSFVKMMEERRQATPGS